MLSAEVKKDRTGLSTPSPKLAEIFGEQLILCPSSEAVQKCMRKELEGARSLLMAADKVQKLTDTGPGPLENKLKGNTPFFLLAYVVLAELKNVESQTSRMVGRVI